MDIYPTMMPDRIRRLIESPIYAAWTKQFDLMALADAGTLDWQNWTEPQWRSVLEWAEGRTQEIPDEIKAHEIKIRWMTH